MAERLIYWGFQRFRRIEMLVIKHWHLFLRFLGNISIAVKYSQLKA